MRRFRNKWVGIVAIIGMFILILKGSIAVTGVRKGIELCLHTVIPSLFPFLILSGLMNSYFLGGKLSLLRPLGRLCKIPAGCEAILLTGLIGGYPVGAQCIYSAYKAGGVSKESAHRLLGFCNNAGPAFIFGMGASLFESPLVSWALWFIHIASAILTGILLPGRKSIESTPIRSAPITLQESVESAIKTIAKICGWVVFFRVIISFLESVFPACRENYWPSLLYGVLELANGIVKLSSAPSPLVRFICASLMLSFGGICVGMQTASVCRELKTGLYFTGKLLQTCISALLSVSLGVFIFPKPHLYKYSYAVLTAMAVSLTILIVSQKKSGNLVNNRI